MEGVQIPLRNRKQEIVAFAIIDKDDEARVSAIRWHLSQGYAFGSIKIGKKQTVVKMHTFILGEPAQKQYIDHINHNRLDNRKNNLRFVTASQNNQNRTKKANATSQYVGVSFNGKHNYPWLAACANGSLGRFKSEIHAAFAYDEYAREHFPGGKTNDVSKPDDFEPFQKQIKKQGSETLPKGIFLMKNGTFTVGLKMEQKCYHRKHYSTLNDALTAHKICTQEIALKKLQKMEAKRQEPIRRNENNVAILEFKNKKSGNIDVLVDDDIYLTYITNARHISHSYPCVKIKGKTVDLHTLVLKRNNESDTIDHIDRNKYNSLRSNLRSVSCAFNAHNVKRSKTNRYSGVFARHSKLGKIRYHARVTHAGIQYHLGFYQDEAVAAWAVDQKSIETYGEGGAINNVKLDGYKFENDRAIKIV